MVNDIIDGISIKLNFSFGDDFEIYADNNVTQGLLAPCFFISLLRPSQSQIIGNRYLRKHPFVIQYFPKNEGDNSEMHNVAIRLLDCMEYITLTDGTLLRGTNMNYEIVNGILHFNINYDFFVKKKEEFNAIDDLELNLKRSK